MHHLASTTCTSWNCPLMSTCSLHFEVAVHRVDELSAALFVERTINEEGRALNAPCHLHTVGITQGRLVDLPAVVHLELRQSGKQSVQRLHVRQRRQMVVGTGRLRQWRKRCRRCGAWERWRRWCHRPLWFGLIAGGPDVLNATQPSLSSSKDRRPWSSMTCVSSSSSQNWSSEKSSLLQTALPIEMWRGARADGS